MLSLSSSSTSTSGRKYDVFLSFRGEDTRRNFTDHLYDALKRRGIFTFKDDPRLEVGEEIAPELIKAIQQSWCSIIVFSKTYAFSSWCLDELVEIVEQKNRTGHKVFPIFYDVDPSDLRKQKGQVGEAFAKHEERYKENKDKIERWRRALIEMANIKGWHLNNRHESEFIRYIVNNIFVKLCQKYSIIPNELIGISSRLKKLYSKIKIGENDVRIIGICGMGGIGKTTLANVVYTQMSPHFEGKSFLADVREVSKRSGLPSLQKQLLSQILLEEGFNIFNVFEGSAMISHRLSHKKVLVVIDDVDNIDQLKWLVGRRDWLGLGSRIIITSRDQHLLCSSGADSVYKLTTLNGHEALQLFNLKAFNSKIKPGNDFVELSKHVVKYANGLPLALEVLGSFLYGRDATQWRSAIERLKRDSNKEIHDRLQISFDELKESEKNIFLDIACFFNGEDKDFVMQLHDGCEFFPHIGIDVLIKKSLLTVDKHNKLRMHDLLQEMGREIVRQKSINEPGQRCRLWKESDVIHVLTNNSATEAIEGMVIGNKGYKNIEETTTMLTLGADAMHNVVIANSFEAGEGTEMFTLSDALLKMKKLRLLSILNLPSSNGVKYLSNELRLFEWHKYPFESLPSTFQPDNLVALLLPDSHIRQLWTANRPLHKLKLVNLKGSQNLINTLDFRMTPNLESLILEGCTRIVDVLPSIRVLRKLKLLNLKDCKRLLRLPKIFGLESLEKLILSGCSNLRRFPEIDGQMKCLQELYLDGTGIKEVPSSIGHLNNLVLLNLKDCSDLVSLPSSIDGCKCLKTLILSGCSKVETLPENLQKVEFLKELDLSQTAIREPPFYVFLFKNLKVLSFSGCKGPPSKSLAKFPSLFKLLHGGSMESMTLATIKITTFSGLTSLTKLSLSYCNLREGDIPSDICCLSSLKELDLRGNNFVYLPATIAQLSRLSRLELSGCKQLKSVPELLSIIKYVNVARCTSLEVFANPKPVCDPLVGCPYLNAISCYRLSKNGNALTMLKSFIKEFVTPSFCILIPGSEIPEWFSFQSYESSIKIRLPPNVGNDSQWLGVALCCVFLSTFADDDVYSQDEMTSKAVIRGRTVNFSGFYLDRYYRRHPVTKKHLWLRYWSRDKLNPFSLKHKCDEVLKFNLQCEGTLEMKKCGVRIVYEKDLEELEQIKEQSNSPASASVDDRDGAHPKRKRNIYEEDAGPSESESDGKTRRPKPLEKIKNLIMGKRH